MPFSTQQLKIVFITGIVACLAARVGFCGAGVTKSNVERATTFFVEECKNESNFPIILAGLRSTEDESLVPFFASLATSGDKKLRLTATSSVAMVGGNKAVLTLADRLMNDPSMLVRSEAIFQLKRLNAADKQLLTRALDIEDDAVKLIAARGLVEKGEKTAAAEVLKELTRSRDLSTSTLARMTLLGIGDSQQIKHLNKVILDKNTPHRLLMRLMHQARESKISAAGPLVDTLVDEKYPLQVRISAYMAKTAVSPESGKEIISEIQKSDNIVIQCNLMKIICTMENSSRLFKFLLKEKGLVGDMARFEIAVGTGGDDAKASLKKMLEPGHPIIVDYVISRMGMDIEANNKKTDFYIGPLLHFVKNADISARRMTPTNIKITEIIKLMGQTDSAESVRAINDLLKEDNDKTLRELVTASLFRCDSEKICRIIHPLVKSPFPKLMKYATLILARHGDRRAIGPLVKLQASSLDSEIELLTLVNWYILKFASCEEAVMQTAASERLND